MTLQVYLQRARLVPTDDGVLLLSLDEKTFGNELYDCIDAYERGPVAKFRRCKFLSTPDVNCGATGGIFLVDDVEYVCEILTGVSKTMKRDATSALAGYIHGGYPRFPLRYRRCAQDTQSVQSAQSTQSVLDAAYVATQTMDTFTIDGGEKLRNRLVPGQDITSAVAECLERRVAWELYRKMSRWHKWSPYT